MYSINMEETLIDAINAIRPQTNSAGAIVEVNSSSGIHRNLEIAIPDLRTVLRAMCALALPFNSYDIFTLNLEEELWFDGRQTLTIEVVRSGSYSDDTFIKKLPDELRAFGINYYEFESLEGLGARGSITINVSFPDNDIIDNFDFLTVTVSPNMDTGSLADFTSKNYSSSLPQAKMPVQSETSHYSEPVEDVELPSIPDISWDYAVMLSGSNSIALETARGFYKSLSSTSNSIDKLHENLYSNDCDQNESLDAYRIAVHGAKGATAAFGAMQLSALCRLLEFAARNHDFNRIEVLHPILISEFKRIKLDWNELTTQEEEKPYSDDNSALLIKLNNLKIALEEFDIDAADSVSKSIDEFCYSDFIQYRIDKLVEAVINIDNDSAINECNELIKLLG